MPLTRPTTCCPRPGCSVCGCGGAGLWWCRAVVVQGCGGAGLWWCRAVVVQGCDTEGWVAGAECTAVVWAICWAVSAAVTCCNILSAWGQGRGPVALAASGTGARQPSFSRDIPLAVLYSSYEDACCAYSWCGACTL
jgi:hypothetical protein